MLSACCPHFMSSALGDTLTGTQAGTFYATDAAESATCSGSPKADGFRLRSEPVLEIMAHLALRRGDVSAVVRVGQRFVRTYLDARVFRRHLAPRVLCTSGSSDVRAAKQGMLGFPWYCRWHVSKSEPRPRTGSRVTHCTHDSDLHAVGVVQTRLSAR